MKFHSDFKLEFLNTFPRSFRSAMMPRRKITFFSCPIPTDCMYIHAYTCIYIHCTEIKLSKIYTGKPFVFPRNLQILLNSHSWNVNASGALREKFFRIRIFNVKLSYGLMKKISSINLSRGISLLRYQMSLEIKEKESLVKIALNHNI